MNRLAYVALAGLVTVAAATAQDQATRLLISGHSLTDRPMPDMVAAIAEHAGRPFDWEMQHLGGSTIRQRLTGSGDAAGVDRDGIPIDLPAVLSRAPAYDVFVVTEWHRVLDGLVAQDTLRHLRDFHALASSSNPKSKTYFYASWANLSDLGMPSDWIDYERRASPVWRCIVQRASPAPGRSIGFIPASLALAELVAYLTNGKDVAGFEGLKPSNVVAVLFSDKVHLTDLGVYFVALVTYGSILDADIFDAWMPPALDQARAATLRTFAIDFFRQWRAMDNLMYEENCSTVSAGFIVQYTAYMKDAYAEAEVGRFWASARQLREIARMMWRFHGWGVNPLVDESAG